MSVSRRDVYIKSHSFENFLADRPKAASLLGRYPAFERWLRTEWNRPIGNFRLAWSDDEPANGAEADHVPIHKLRLIVIHVSDKLQPADQLVDLAYEICNAQGLPGRDALVSQAAAGKITRKAFVDAIDESEYEAVLHLRNMLPSLLPLPTDEITGHYRAFVEVPLEFHKYQAWCISNHMENYLRAQDLYSRDYDKIVGHKQSPGTPDTALKPTPTAP